MQPGVGRDRPGRAGGPGRRRPGELPHRGGVVVVRGAVPRRGRGGGGAGELAHRHRVVVVRGAVAQLGLHAGRGGGQGGLGRRTPGEVLAVGPGTPGGQPVDTGTDPGRQAGRRARPAGVGRHQTGDGERLVGRHRGLGPGDPLGRRQAGQLDRAPVAGVGVRSTQPSSAAGPDDRVLQRLGHGVSSPARCVAAAGGAAAVREKSDLWDARGRRSATRPGGRVTQPLYGPCRRSVTVRGSGPHVDPDRRFRRSRRGDRSVTSIRAAWCGRVACDERCQWWRTGRGSAPTARSACTSSAPRGPSATV